MTLFQGIGILFTAVAVFGYFNHRFLKLPDTLGITAMGLLVTLVLAWMGSTMPHLTHWAQQFAFQLNFSEVVFHGLLGVLLFAGSLHVCLSDLEKQKWPIITLATAGVLISTAVVGYCAYYLLALMGFPVSLTYCLMFGALISPTDPIAVLGVLKTAGVPKALETKISGESLFNDGTGVVAYMVLLGIATGTGTHEPSVLSIGGLLLKEIVGAVALGLAVGYTAFFMLKGLDSYPVEILLTLALATGGYALAEYAHVSAPLAVVVMGLVIGNHGAKSAMSPTTREHLFSFWALLDEVLNLVLFGLIGIKFLSLAASEVSWVHVGAMVPLVLFARWVSVGLPALVLRNWLEVSPHSVKVLTWGGLRGGISIALALSLPASGEKSFFVMATYAVVIFSLLVQAPTLGWVLRRYGVSKQ
jgi:monovalent cation:H+ antiporter, CPA1 family